jgi:hypothetical protein
VFGEMLAHGLTYIRLDQNVRLGAGATGGLTFDRSQWRRSDVALGARIPRRTDHRRGGAARPRDTSSEFVRIPGRGHVIHTGMTLDPEICWRAWTARDARFVGRFVMAVTSTHIYCRPGCPARLPARRNVRFYATPAAAEAAGFRACLRCRPDRAPGFADRGRHGRDGDTRVAADR